MRLWLVLLSLFLPFVAEAQTVGKRSLFKEIGQTDAAIEAKLNAVWTLYFEGKDANSRLMYDYNAQEAYVLNARTDNPNNPQDVRSEGQSYGMFIAVQMNKKEAFDKLWTFAHNRMLIKSGPREGYFCWHFNPTDKNNKPNACISEGSAPDGEIYFAAALYLAHQRWGSTGADGAISNYKYWADEIAREMLHQEEDNGGVVDNVTNMFDAKTDLVVFVPSGKLATFSDPSYQLPHLFELFALWGPEADRARWGRIVAASRDHLHTVRRKSPNTCLSPEYSNFDGTAVLGYSNGQSQFHVADAWRVVQNVGLDAHWWGKDARQPIHAYCVLRFFADPVRGGGLKAYQQRYDLTGRALMNNYPHGAGQTAMNAAGVLAINSDFAPWSDGFVTELWQIAPPSGDYRYYHGLLYMLGLLAASDHYRYAW